MAPVRTTEHVEAPEPAGADGHPGMVPGKPALTLVQDPTIFVPAVYEPHPGIGASQVGTILGANPYATPLDLRQELLGLKPPFEGNDDSECGQALEPVIARKFGRLYNKILAKGGSVQHPDHGFAWGTPDYLILEDGRPAAVLECKNTRYWKTPKGPHDMRPSFRLQVRWQLACTGLDHGFVHVHHMAEPSKSPKRWEALEVRRDLELEEGMLAIVGMFHAHVEACRGLLADGMKPEDLPPLPDCFTKRSP